MKLKDFLKTVGVLLIGLGFLTLTGRSFADGITPGSQQATEDLQELINPEGVVHVEPLKLNPHPSTLENKTIMLRWNGKHNGDQFLNRIGELLTEKFEGVRIIKSWQVAPDTVVAVSGSQERSMELMKKLAAFKPDIVIGSQAD
jgi:hypothetical protein